MLLLTAIIIGMLLSPTLRKGKQERNRKEMRRNFPRGLGPLSKIAQSVKGWLKKVYIERRGAGVRVVISGGCGYTRIAIGKGLGG